MKRFETFDLIDINKKKGFPRVYRFNPFIRWFVIMLSLFAIAYSVYYIFAIVDAETSTFRKIIPFVIIFFAANSLFRNLFSLNSLTFREDGIVFRYLANKGLFINWKDILKMTLYSGKTRAVKLHYLKDGNEKVMLFTMNFPNMLEIINSIAEMCPQLEFDEFMKNITLTEQEREEARKKEVKEE